MTFKQYSPASAIGGDHAFFDTVAEMKSGALANGDQCHTAGYSAVGDGGGSADGYTYHDAGQSGETEDGGFVIFGTVGDDWLSANNQSVANVLQFGATGGADDTVAVQAAINSIAPEVLIPEITLTCSNLTIPSYRRIIGLGHNSILQQKAGESSPFIHMEDTRPGLPYLSRCIETSLADLTIMGVEGEGHVGVLLTSTYQVRFSNVRVATFRDPATRTGVGLQFVDNNDAINTRCAFTDCLIDNCDTAVEMDSAFSNRSVGYHKFHGLNIGMEAVGLRLKNTNPNGSINNLFSGVMFQDSNAIDGDFHAGTVVSATSTTIQLEAAGASAVNDSYVGATVYIKAGIGTGQIRECSGYVAIGEVLTVSSVWSITPDDTSVYVVTKRIHVDCNGQGNTFIATVHDNTSGVDILMRENAQGNQVYNPAAGSIYDNLQVGGGARNTMHSATKGEGGWGLGDPFVFGNIDGGVGSIMALTSAGLPSADAGPEFRLSTTNSSIQYRQSITNNDATARWNFIGVDGGVMAYFYDLHKALKVTQALFLERGVIDATGLTELDLDGKCHLLVTASAPTTIATFTNGNVYQLLYMTTMPNVTIADSAFFFLDSAHDGTKRTKWIFLSNSSNEFEEHSRSVTP